MPPYESVLKAKTLLGLHDKATLPEIKTRYKNLMHRWHPDKHPDDPDTANTMSARINDAYKILLEFVKHYEYRLDEPYLKETCLTPQEWWERKFGGR
ncbi:J domain-containing protein [Sulfurimonas sp. HSL-3221]|uniref:J domain-containing protein n=1 Tax=Sulfurimonas diazotrophicus TaxID=3131939 RepID=A0ABZ3HE06_9BACT|nr:J domain-containing protein [Sulfurimonas sp. HSL-3221]UFS63430.1 J domain-containing protein [Sulfurimonas sp. HSL-3221]